MVPKKRCNNHAHNVLWLTRLPSPHMCTHASYLKVVDRYGDSYISAYVTPGHILSPPPTFHQTLHLCAVVILLCCSIAPPHPIPSHPIPPLRTTLDLIVWFVLLAAAHKPSFCCCTRPGNAATMPSKHSFMMSMNCT